MYPSIIGILFHTVCSVVCVCAVCVRCVCGVCAVCVRCVCGVCVVCLCVGTYMCVHIRDAQMCQCVLHPSHAPCH